MNLLWRFLYTVLFSRFFKPLSLFDEGSIFFRVYPTDADLLFHMNNGRYFSFMDLGRINLMVRNKTYAIMRTNGLYPVVASEMIRFKKSVNLFKRFELTTKLIGWDEKFFYLVQHFKVKNEVYVLGLVKACFLNHKHKRVNTSELLSLIGNPDPIEMPDWVKDWQRADQEFHDETMSAAD